MRKLLLFVCLLCSSHLFAQMKEQRVFLWDVSESLISNGMWKPLQNALIEGINSIDEDAQSRIVLVPFYTKPLKNEVINVPATKEGKKKLTDFIKARTCHADGLGSKTNIVGAIQKFHELANKEYINYMFLYTDGKNEVGNLCNELDAWNKKMSDKRCYGFYVLVHEAADNPCVRSAEQSQTNLWVVRDANQKIKICSLAETVVCDVRKDKKIRLNIAGAVAKFNGNIILKAQDNPYYSVKIIKQDIQEGFIDIEVCVKTSSKLPQEFPLKVDVSTDGKDPYSFVTPEVLTVKCINKPIRTLKIGIK